MNWKNLKIGTKLSIAFSIVLLILIVVSGLSISGIGQIISDTNEVIAGNELNAELENIYVRHLIWAQDLNHYIIDDTHTDFNCQTDHTQCIFGKWYYGEGRIKAELLDPKLKPLLDQFEEPHKQLHASAAEIKSTYLKHQTLKVSEDEKGQALKLFLEKTTPNLKQLSQLFTSTLETAKADILSINGMLDKARLTRTSIFTFSLIAVIAGILLTLLVTKGIVNPIRKSISMAQQIAEGDLAADIDIRQHDEVGQLVDSLRFMANKIKEVVFEVQEASNQIAAASQQINSSSQSMSQGASEQAASLEEISSSMEQMVANIKQNADNAQETQKIAAESVNSVSKGSNSTMESLEAMRNFAGKITIINDIASQTNILALNAAVEAARAGDVGKGFAVVATEVRKLAERSRIAADEISILSKNGVSISQKSGEQLLAIVPRIEKTANLVQEIAAASLEQDAGAEQINKAIQQLNMVSQQNASSSEEMAANSEELASQAISLQQIISYFKVAEQIGSSKMPELNEYPKKMKKEKLHRDDSKFTGKAHYKGEVTNIDKKILKSKIVTEKADNPKVNKGFQLQFTSDDKSDIDFKSF